jgi:DNA-binding NarL/FixJ family response regulator
VDRRAVPRWPLGRLVGSRPVRLVIADDHPLILEGLVHLFETVPDFEIVERCSRGDQALAAVERHRPDVLLLDIVMPGLDGLAVIRELRRRELPTQVIVLTAALDERLALDAARLGVEGIVLKEMAPRLLIQCIRKVHGGERWVETRSLQAAFERALAREAGMSELRASMTPREVELIRMVSDGLRNREIASRLHITVGTVKSHLYNVYKKAGVDNRVALRRYAEEKGLI